MNLWQINLKWLQSFCLRLEFFFLFAEIIQLCRNFISFHLHSCYIFQFLNCFLNCVFSEINQRKMFLEFFLFCEQSLGFLCPCLRIIFLDFRALNLKLQNQAFEECINGLKFVRAHYFQLSIRFIAFLNYGFRQLSMSVHRPNDVFSGFFQDKSCKFVIHLKNLPDSSFFTNSWPECSTMHSMQISVLHVVQ